MFFFYKNTKGSWAIAYKEGHDYMRSLVCMVNTPQVAAALCSWFNGGQKPEPLDLYTIEWIGE